MSVSKFQYLKSKLSIPRADGVTDWQAVLAYGGRFTDELLGSLPDVLMPTIQRTLGLSLTQVGALRAVLDIVAAGVEPLNGLLADVLQRKWLMAWGAFGLGLAMFTIGFAPTFLVLVLAYAIYGMASGPLAHTGDVVLVDAYPEAPDRAFTRSTMIDTIGALLGPIVITLTLWLGWSWRVPLFVLGGFSMVYALLILRTGFPLPQQHEEAQEAGMVATLKGNVREIAGNSVALRWLTLLFFFSVLETPFILETIWLAEEVGMSQATIGLYKSAELAVGFVALLLLDRWRQRVDSKHILRISVVGFGLGMPAWLLIPGIWSKFILMIPLTIFLTFFWPLLRGESLASVPGKAGVVTAFSSLFGLIPLPILFGWLGDSIGLTPAMLGVHLVAILVMGVLVWRLQE